MKQLIITLILAISCSSLIAQQNNIPYYPQSGLHKFEGEWLYIDGNSTFKITLKIEKTFLKSYPLYTDFIVGYYVYTKNRSVLQNTIGKNKTITSGGFIDRNNPNKIKFLLDDLGRASDSKAPLERGTLELLSDSVAKWTIKPGEGIRLKGQRIKENDYNIYVPKYLILKKVK